MSYTYNHPRVLTACDCVILTLINNQLDVFLVRNKDQSPEVGWRLPGKILKIREVEGRQWDFYDVDSENKFYRSECFPNMEGYPNGYMLHECAKEAIRFSVPESEQPGFSFYFSPLRLFELPVRDCPFRDKDRSIIEPNSIKFWRVLSVPYLLFANPFLCGPGEYLTKQQTESLFRDDVDIELVDVGDRQLVARWVSVYKVLKDNGITIRERMEPEDHDSDKRKKKSDENKKLRPSEEIKTVGGSYKLLFDHRFILEDSIKELRRIGRREPLGNDLFRKRTFDGSFEARFTMLDITRLYSLVYDKTLSLPNIKNILKDRSLITPVKEGEKDLTTQEGTKTRPAVVYRFDPEWYEYYMENQNLGLKL